MNFYETEMKRIFRDSEVLQTPQFCGKTCLAILDDDLRVKIQFSTERVADQYVGLLVSVINRTEGVIDREMFYFSDVLGDIPKLASNPFAKNIHIWECDGKAEWYSYKPTQDDYKSIEATISGYLSLYQEETIRMGGQMM